MMEEIDEEVVENPTLRAAFSLAPLHQGQPLQWDYEAHLIGEKILNKMIHLCEICELPILVYGRMLPCKHIFCFGCARKSEKACRRCNGKVQKVEKSALGTVFVCTHGAPKHDVHGCRRTYLSHRDLQSHIAHRHQPKAPSTKHVPSNPVAQQAPVQMPLTQQQAAQQASQKQIPTSVQSHLQASNMAVQSLIPASGLALTHSQSTGLPVSGQQMSPIPPLIPGLGDLRPSPGMLSQNSPMAQATQSPNTLQQGLALSYGTAAQPNPDIYRALEMTALGQQQPPALQQGIGMHLALQNLQQYPKTQQFPASAPLIPQLSQGMVAPLHNMPPLSHQHSALPVQQNLDTYSKPPSVQSPSLSAPQSRNLITVPIQDEGQYRPLPYVPPMSSQSNHPSYQQGRPLTSNSFSSSNNYNLINTQNNLINTQNQSIGHPSALGGAQNMGHMGGSPAQNIGHSQNLSVQSQSLATQVSNLVGLTQNMVSHAQTLGGQVQNISGNSQLQYPPVSNNAGLMINPRPNNPHSRPLNNTPTVNRFQQHPHWQNPRGIQPRMSQGQNRPRPDNQFNHGNYYS
ncbi:E3 ubiquitin-protein ligase Hakai [Biomphalaria glabrata]|nr:E3 ubiquitin-protein ligase Hakai [Biomphalaria glabrata]